jgi:hypothetical protein
MDGMITHLLFARPLLKCPPSPGMTWVVWRRSNGAVPRRQPPREVHQVWHVAVEGCTVLCPPGKDHACQGHHERVQCQLRVSSLNISCIYESLLTNLCRVPSFSRCGSVNQKQTSATFSIKPMLPLLVSCSSTNLQQSRSFRNNFRFPEGDPADSNAPAASASSNTGFADDTQDDDLYA